MSKQYLWKLTAILACTIASSAIAQQEAMITQIGDQNNAVNLDAGINVQTIAQIGESNDAVQGAVGRGNILGTAQVGRANTAAQFALGSDNLIGTAQIGFGNVSLVRLAGSGNSIGTLQYGFGHSSSVTLVGNNATVGVTQLGANRRSQLTVVDNYIAGTQSANGVSTGTNARGGLDVGVFQGARDAPVNASVGRDAAGNIVVRPGTATTILRLPPLGS